MMRVDVSLDAIKTAVTLLPFEPAVKHVLAVVVSAGRI
jgi:hypothetical protein